MICKHLINGVCEVMEDGCIIGEGCSECSFYDEDATNTIEELTNKISELSDLVKSLNEELEVVSQVNTEQRRKITSLTEKSMEYEWKAKLFDAIGRGWKNG